MKIRAFGRSALLPVLVLIAVGLVAGLAGYLNAGSNGANLSANGQSDETVYIRGVVQEVSPGSLTLAIGAERRSFALAASTPVEALQPLSLSAVRAGDWLNVGAVPHAQTLFAITGLVVIPENNLQTP